MDQPAEQSEPTDPFEGVSENLLIVVGAHPTAEREHRPLAYRLREHILRWFDEQKPGEIDQPRPPLVLCDLWYLNQRDLLHSPVISIGEAEVNAATAYLSGRLPTAIVIDHVFRVQADLEFIDLKACIWGASSSATASAIDLFVERYLHRFLAAAHDLPTSGTDA